MKLLVLVASLLCLSLTGCGTLDPAGPYKGDKALHSADLTLVTSFAVLDTFVKYEYNNRAALASTPKVRELADRLRAQAPLWRTRILALRDVYAVNPSPENHKNLTTGFSVLQEAVHQVSEYLINP